MTDFEDWWNSPDGCTRTIEQTKVLAHRAWDAAYQAGRDSMKAEAVKVCETTPPYPFRPSIEAALTPTHDDTALLRQCLEGYESMTGRKPERIEKLVTALRERLGEKTKQVLEKFEQLKEVK